MRSPLPILFSLITVASTFPARLPVLSSTNMANSTTTSPHIAAGAELFATHGCAHCHGPAGIGGDRGPDLQQVRKRMKPNQITHRIQAGAAGMPAYADQLTPTEIQDLVTYLCAKRK